MLERNWEKDWELCQQLAPGPWELKKILLDCYEYELRDAEGRDLLYVQGSQWFPEWDESTLRFIVEAREALSYWLQRVRELEKQVQELEEEICLLQLELAEKEEDNK